MSAWTERQDKGDGSPEVLDRMQRLNPNLHTMLKPPKECPQKGQFGLKTTNLVKVECLMLDAAGGRHSGVMSSQSDHHFRLPSPIGGYRRARQPKANHLQKASVRMRCFAFSLLAYSYLSALPGFCFRSLRVSTSALDVSTINHMVSVLAPWGCFRK